MEILKNVLLVIHVIVCFLMVVIVLMQTGKEGGLSGTIQGGSSDSFFGKNKGKTRDAILSKITVVLAVLFLALTIALTVVINKIGRTNAEIPVSETPVVEQVEEEAPEAEEEPVATDDEGEAVGDPAAPEAE